MIQTVTIDIINEKALRLLKELEYLELIRLHQEKGEIATVKWAEKYKGAMTKQSPSEIDNQLRELREGWE
ncbi:hypothetical protein [Dawidia soli]|uniref:Uncharacterized protein n=1 Tax=Dawidia soli TaxID=2782352 RepID=A0AAP2DC09_9BACT|nr:hypothetical protein [Dawidia soli]MBT1689204.1 hypothetical protein [Dawidia soli]